MKFDQDLCKNLQYDLRSYFGKQNSPLGSVVPLAMFNLLLSAYCWREVCGGKRFVTAKFVVRRSRRKKVQWTALTNHQGHSFILSAKRNEEQFLNKLIKSLVNHS